MATAKELNANLFGKHVTKQRTNWKKEVKLERSKVINEAIENIKKEMRTVPKVWHRGYFSAITVLELMK